MAQPTMAEVVALARITLQDRDSDAYRMSDDDLLEFANNGLDEFFQMRPDLFIGQMSLATASEGHQLALGNALPIDGRWKRLLADYVISRTETGDDEHQNAGRAGAFMKQLERRLVG